MSSFVPPNELDLTGTRLGAGLSNLTLSRSSKDTNSNKSKQCQLLALGPGGEFLTNSNPNSNKTSNFSQSLSLSSKPTNSLNTSSLKNNSLNSISNSFVFSDKNSLENQNLLKGPGPESSTTIITDNLGNSATSASSSCATDHSTNTVNITGSGNYKLVDYNCNSSCSTAFGRREESGISLDCDAAEASADASDSVEADNVIGTGSVFGGGTSVVGPGPASGSGVPGPVTVSTSGAAAVTPNTITSNLNLLSSLRARFEPPGVNVQSADGHNPENITTVSSQSLLREETNNTLQRRELDRKIAELKDQLNRPSMCVSDSEGQLSESLSLTKLVKTGGVASRDNLLRLSPSPG